MIGDLLAQITGDGDAGSTTANTSQLPKRKAGDDLARPSISKAPRTASIGGDNSSRLSNSRGPLDLSTKTTLPTLSHASEPSRVRPVASVSGPFNSTAPSRRLSATPSRYGATTSQLSSATDRGRGPVSTVLGGNRSNSDVTSLASKPAPKKGSYLEIMERAKAAQAAMGQVGKIQHKPLEKGPTKRERMVVQAEEARVAKNRNGKSKMGVKRPMPRPSVTRPISSRPLSGPRESRTGTNRRPMGNVAEAGKTSASAPGRSETAGRKSGPSKEEKQPKKAATATTGYQGTARPRPNSSTSATASRPDSGTGDSKSSYRPAARPRVPFGGPRRSRYEEEMDEEMDDFIEYDDDDDVGHPERRGHGWSDEEDGFEDESDMEAGISDIDEEEHMAERVARLEDAQQEALERKLKAEKEQRKRQAVASSDYRRNSSSGLLRR